MPMNVERQHVREQLFPTLAGIVTGSGATGVVDDDIAHVHSHFVIIGGIIVPDTISTYAEIDQAARSRWTSTLGRVRTRAARWPATGTAPPTSSSLPSPRWANPTAPQGSARARLNPSPAGSSSSPSPRFTTRPSLPTSSAGSTSPWSPPRLTLTPSRLSAAVITRSCSTSATTRAHLRHRRPLRKNADYVMAASEESQQPGAALADDAGTGFHSQRRVQASASRRARDGGGRGGDRQSHRVAVERSMDCRPRRSDSSRNHHVASALGDGEFKPDVWTTIQVPMNTARKQVRDDIFPAFATIAKGDHGANHRGRRRRHRLCQVALCPHRRNRHPGRRFRRGRHRRRRHRRRVQSARGRPERSDGAHRVLPPTAPVTAARIRRWPPWDPCCCPMFPPSESPRHR